MNKQFITKKIKDLVPWYQCIDLNGIMTLKRGDNYFNANAGEKTWNTIKTFLPSSLDNNRILDLGCNAGFYSIKSSLLGAKEVVGIELSPIFFEQALFIKEFFEEVSSRKLNVKYIKSDIGNLDLDNIGNFDYIFAIAILYHIGKHKYGKYTENALKEQKDVIRKLALHTKKFIVRCRNSQFNNREYYKQLFKEVNFTETKYIPEGKRGMILYESKT